MMRRGCVNRFPRARFYEDYRQMMDQNDLQAVLIATPDHHHAPASIRAIERGKHVFVEKPMTWCLYEARKLNLSAQQAETFIRTAYAIADAINSRALPQEEST